MVEFFFLLLFEALMKRVRSPIVKHARMDEVLIRGGQLLGQQTFLGINRRHIALGVLLSLENWPAPASGSGSKAGMEGDPEHDDRFWILTDVHERSQAGQHSARVTE